jgi:hypothetical protein
MAKRIEKPVAKKADTGADDLEILHPDRAIFIGDHEIIVREYSFVEWLKMRAMAQPIINDLERLLMSDEPIDDDQVFIMLSQNSDVVLTMLMKSTGLAKENIDQLEPSDGERLLYLWWCVNSHLFIRRVMERRDRNQLQTQGNQNLDGPTSMPC